MPLDLNWLFAYPKLQTIYENLRMAREMFPYELEEAKQKNIHQDLTNQVLQQSLGAILREQQKQSEAESLIKGILDKIETVRDEGSLLERAGEGYKQQLVNILSKAPVLPPVTTNIGGADTTDAIISMNKQKLIDDYIKQNQSDISNILDNINTVSEAYKSLEDEKKSIQSGIFSKDVLGKLLPYTGKENMINVISNILEKMGKSTPLKVFATKDILSKYGFNIPGGYLGSEVYVDDNMRPVALAEAPKKMEYKELAITPQEAVSMGIQLPKGFEKTVTKIKGYIDESNKFVPTDYDINTSLETMFASMARGNKSDLLQAADFIEKAEKNKIKNAMVSIANSNGIQLPNTDDVNLIWQTILANQNRISIYDRDTLRNLYRSYVDKVSEVEDIVERTFGLKKQTKKTTQMNPLDYLKSKIKGSLNE